MSARTAIAAFCKPFSLVLLATLGTLAASVLVLLAVTGLIFLIAGLTGDFSLFLGDMTAHVVSIVRNAALTGMVIGVAANLKTVKTG